MERTELNITSLKKEIHSKKLKIQSLNYKLNTETNEYLLEDLEKDMNLEKNSLVLLDKKLNVEIINDKKIKILYKKHLKVMKESLINFAKITRNNDILKKQIAEINKIISMMEKYLN